MEIGEIALRKEKQETAVVRRCVVSEKPTSLRPALLWLEQIWPQSVWSEVVDLLRDAATVGRWRNYTDLLQWRSRMLYTVIRVDCGTLLLAILCIFLASFSTTYVTDSIKLTSTSQVKALSIHSVIALDHRIGACHMDD